MGDADELSVEGASAVQPEETPGDQVDIPDDKVIPEPEVPQEPSEAELGLRNDLIEERARARAAEQQAEFLRDFAKGQEEKKGEVEVDQDEFLSRGEVEKLLATKIEESLKTDRKNNRMRVVNEQETRMREDNPDYDDVYKKYIEPQMRSDPDFLKMLDGAVNAPQAAYNWAMTQPEVVQQKINKAMKTPSAKQKIKTLSDAGSGGISSTPVTEVAKLEALDDVAFENLLLKIKRS